MFKFQCKCFSKYSFSKLQHTLIDAYRIVSATCVRAISSEKCSEIVCVKKFGTTLKKYKKDKQKKIMSATMALVADGKLVLLQPSNKGTIMSLNEFQTKLRKFCS